jgi:hypothetical protein
MSRSRASDFSNCRHSSSFARRPQSRITPPNLQAQLVPPNSRDHNRSTSSRRSSDSLATNPEAEGQPPTRKSFDRSYLPIYSGSVNSFSSTAPTRRTIIPLYNLQAYNLMTNVVLDVGTGLKSLRNAASRSLVSPFHVQWKFRITASR